MIHFLIAFISSVSAQTMNPEETNYFYSETVPKHKVVMDFEFPQCHKSETLDIERRNSNAELYGKKVRYVFLRGRLTGTPDKCTGKLMVTTLKHEIEPDKNLMTHVFLVVDRKVKLTKIEAK